jgi:hypothetical protein
VDISLHLKCSVVGCPTLESLCALRYANFWTVAIAGGVGLGATVERERVVETSSAAFGEDLQLWQGLQERPRVAKT